MSTDPSSGLGLTAAVGMVPEGLCDSAIHRVPPVFPSSPVWALNQAIVSRSRVTVTPLDEAVLQGLLLSHRPLVGLGEEFLGGLGVGPVLFGPLVCIRVLGQLGGDLRLLFPSRPDEVRLSLVRTGLSPSRSAS